jgi:putative redox protein
MIDKSKELHASITLINDRLHFTGIVENTLPVSIDYFPPLGDNAGYTSLELLLLSLSSCAGTAVLTFLRKMKKNITGFEIHSHGIRKENHPTGFKTIHLEITIHSADTTEDEVKKVLTLSEETYCPVWAMLKGNVDITVATTIISNN